MGYVIFTAAIVIILVWMFWSKIRSWVAPMNAGWWKERPSLTKTIKVVFVSLIALTVAVVLILFYLKSTGFFIASLIIIGILCLIYPRQVWELIKAFWKVFKKLMIAFWDVFTDWMEDFWDWFCENWGKVIVAIIIIAAIVGVVLAFCFWSIWGGVWAIIGLILLVWVIAAILDY